MRISRLSISNFRCIDQLEIELDDLTVFVGANSTGKSSVLHALRWFFEGGNLELEDVGGAEACQELADEDRIVSVAVTFDSLSAIDKKEFGSYIIDNQLSLWRKWTPGEQDKLTGRGLAFPPFNEIRASSSASDKNRAYKRLQEQRPDLGLPSTRSAAQVDQALDEWEKANPTKLIASDVEANHLFGFVGGAKLRGRYDFVLVPATSDPEAQAKDAPKTLLRQLVERAGAASAIKARLKEIEEGLLVSVRELVASEGSEPLEELSERITEELNRLIPGGRVTLDALPLQFQLPVPGVEIRVADGGVETSVGRQGHGFQRALLIALIQQLAAPRNNVDNPPGLFLAIEEPELYQHPLQSRHFARTLEQLTQDGKGTIQIAYATHSEHFVDASSFERLRRFRREVASRDWPTASVSRAAFGDVANRLKGIYDSKQIMLRVKLTLRRQLSEAFFARAVVLVEGDTDAALLHGLADRAGGLDSLGIAIVPTKGKGNLSLSLAILEELGVPTFTLFDGDAGLESRLRQADKGDETVASAVNQAATYNRQILKVIGEPEDDFPFTRVRSKYAVLHDCLETELAEWREFRQKEVEMREQTGDWRGKSEDIYRQAAAEVAEDPPALFQTILKSILALPNSSFI